ncbi:MAG: hypothetical protein C5B43_01890 [Verrucomicrobia bacterium]|nr:MAG: hypothetical protein C5B43_01890 [Verrucomicrobiota bacterium]
MRFILGFIFFGLLFYGIWYFFPEAFQTLATWAGNVFDFFKTLFTDLSNKFQSSKETSPAPTKETTQAALLFFSFYLLKFKK